MVPLAGAPAAAGAQDVLTLANGDRLTGRLTAIAGSTWTFRYRGAALRLPVGAVTSFAAANRVGLRLSDGTITAGRVTVTAGAMRFTTDDGTVRPIAPADLAAVGDPDDLAALRPVAIGFLSPIYRFWSATIGAGFAAKTGNSRSRGFNGDLKVQRRTAKDRLAFTVGAATEWAGDPAAPDAGLTKVVEKYYGGGRLDVFVSRAVFLFGSTQQEADRFQGIELRSNYNTGLGYQVIATDATDLRFDVSGGLRVETFTPTAGDTTASVAIASAGSQLRQRFGPLELDWSLRWTPAVDNLEDYRFLSEAGLNTKLFGGLGFRIGSRNEFNNNPPSGLEKHDWLLAVNLTYAIGG